MYSKEKYNNHDSGDGKRATESIYKSIVTEQTNYDGAIFLLESDVVQHRRRQAEQGDG